MKSTSEELDSAADEFVRLSGNSGIKLNSEGFVFDIDETTRNLHVLERTIRPNATGNDLVTRDYAAAEWFDSLAALSGIEADIYDITYLKIAVKNRLRSSESELHG